MQAYIVVQTLYIQLPKYYYNILLTKASSAKHSAILTILSYTDKLWIKNLIPSLEFSKHVNIQVFQQIDA